VPFVLKAKPVEERPRSKENSTDDIVDPQTVSTTSSFSTAESTKPRNLWDEAYNTLRQKDEKLTDAYEKFLLESQFSHHQGMVGRGYILKAGVNALNIVCCSH
jgi:hypothetical protein